MSSYTNNKDLKQVLAVASIVMLSLIGVLMFSPLASQFNDAPGRGLSCTPIINKLIIDEKYEEAYGLVNSEIAGLEESVSGIAYLDRFLPKDKRYKASLSRLEIYELQWKRIEILSEMDDKVPLHKALKEYAAIIGYHQEEAKELMNQMEGK